MNLQLYEYNGIAQVLNDGVMLYCHKKYHKNLLLLLTEFYPQEMHSVHLKLQTSEKLKRMLNFNNFD